MLLKTLLAQSLATLWLLILTSSYVVAAESMGLSRALAQPHLMLAYNSSFRPTGSTRGSDEDAGDFKVRRPDAQAAELIEQTLAPMLDKIKLGKGRDKLVPQLLPANAGQKALYAIYLFRRDVSAGGFKAYFGSASADLLPELKKGLLLVKASKYVMVLNRAMKIFADDEHMLDDAFNRRTVMEKMDDFELFQILEAADSQFTSLEMDNLLLDKLQAYINAHAQQFYAKNEE